MYGVADTPTIARKGGKVGNFKDRDLWSAIFGLGCFYLNTRKEGKAAGKSTETSTS